MQLTDRVPAQRGFLTLHVYESGRLIETWDGENIIVDLSKGQNARLWGGDVTNRSISKIGFGTSGSVPAAGNQSLTSAFLKSIDAVTYPSDRSVSFEFSLTTAEANGTNILELGLLTTAGVLMARKTRSSVLQKTSDIALSGIWRIEF